MQRNTFLFFLALAGSALCVWPSTPEPSLPFPWWTSFAVIPVVTWLATLLSGGYWLRFVVASAAGTFARRCLGAAISQPTDGIAASYEPYVAVAFTLAATVLSLVAGFAGRKTSLSSGTIRSAACLGLIGCVAFGPVILLVTPKLAVRRVARNDRIAAERFASLKSAVQETMDATKDSGQICDGQSLKRHYSGLPFRQGDWDRITGNAVKQDGYHFIVYCHQKDGYTIAASPIEARVDGTRQFCSDESGNVGCGMEWNGSRNACIPCGK